MVSRSSIAEKSEGKASPPFLLIALNLGALSKVDHRPE